MTRQEFELTPFRAVMVKVLFFNICSFRRMVSLLTHRSRQHALLNASRDEVLQLVHDLENAEEELSADIQRQLAKCFEALSLINKLPEPERTVLRLHFVSRYTWEQVADIVCYTTSNVYRINRRAFLWLFQETPSTKKHNTDHVILDN